MRHQSRRFLNARLLTERNRRSTDPFWHILQALVVLDSWQIEISVAQMKPNRSILFLSKRQWPAGCRPQRFREQQVVPTEQN